jgi:hypothetical protein
LPWEEILDEICGHNRPLLAVATTTALYEARTPNWHAVVIAAYKIEGTGVYEVHKVRVFDPQEDLPDNYRFFTYDEFFLSDYTHDRDYVDIGSNRPDITPTNSDVTPPAAPQGVRIF